MGNVCTSSQKKGSISEKSEESFEGGVNHEAKTTEVNNSSHHPEEKRETETGKEVTAAGEEKSHQNVEGSKPPKLLNNQPSIQESTAKSSSKGDEQRERSPTYLEDICTFMLHGRVLPDGKSQRTKKIVIYILADSNDASANEDSVEYKRYKRLLQGLHQRFSLKCQSHGYEFLMVDLQASKEIKYSDSSESRLFWDIGGWVKCPRAAQGGHQEMANRLNDLRQHLNDNCYIIPILILGSVLGHGIPLLPLTIQCEHFKALLAAAGEEEGSLLEEWYALEKSMNGQPLRYRLCSPDSISRDMDGKSEELYRLFEVMLKYFSNDLKNVYLTTVVEQELRQIVFRNPELCKYCIWLQTGVHQGTPREDAGNGASVGRQRWWRPLEIERERRLGKLYSDLRMHLYEKNIIRLLPTMNFVDDDITEVLEELLSASITKIFDENANSALIPYNTRGIDRALFTELEMISRFTRILTRNTNIEVLQESLTEVENYIQDTSSSNQPLILYGRTGSGKSVLVAKVAEMVHRWRPDTHLILRYMHLSPRSSDLLNLLGSIVQQLSILLYGRQIQVSHDVENYKQLLQSLLKTASKFIVILIDSIDFGKDNSQQSQWDWLPLELNANCKMILSITSNAPDPEQNTASEGDLQSLLVHGVATSSFRRVKEFDDSQWKSALVSCRVDWRERTLIFGGGYECMPALTEPWSKSTCAENDCSPFHVKVLRWLQWMNASATAVQPQSGLQPEMFIFQFLLESSQFSTDHCEFLLLLVVLSKWGIRETDCLEIFQTLTKMDALNTYKVWSRFCWLLSPWLQIINGHFRITERRLRDLILEKYQSQYYKVHKAIRDHYERKELCLNAEKNIYNATKLANLPLHQFALTIEDNNKGPNTELAIDGLLNSVYLSDLQWIADKVQALGPTHLLHDILVAEDFLKTKDHNQSRRMYLHIEFLKRFLQFYHSTLNYDGQQFLTLFKYHLQKYFVSDAVHYPKDHYFHFDVEELKGNGRICAWLDFVNKIQGPLLEIISSNFNITNEDSDAAVVKDPVETAISHYDALVYLPHKGNFVASISHLHEEISIWNVASCQRVRLLQGVPQPIAMCPFGMYDAAVLCRREIKTFNLDEGQLKVTLKGVMNQKMPYFGLHDQKHLVCLSRNRMYVNLMNLDSGDCVTTFKAGEDRFLNSLLVSGDGRILVCGDETQKPFPLLVWHLSQRKLLYDLRIPHHDFLTSLSAITHEGSYVAVVAKELNEPNPNFIVVYDLQSGTLFKKWKPSTDTVALAISQLNACVIAGLADAKIMVWDLVTGNCRWNLTGHNAPVTSLKLDPLGKVLLSFDKEGCDPALRLWELNSGKSLAVLKLSRRITAYEILPNGSHVVVGLDSDPELVILALRNYGEATDSNTAPIYGNQDNQGKVFNLNLV